MQTPQAHIPRELVGDMLLDAMDSEDTVLKVKVSHDEVEGRGFLIKREDDLSLLVEQADGSYGHYDGRQLKGAVKSAAALMYDDVVKVAKSKSMPDVVANSNATIEDSVFNKARHRIVQHLDTINDLVGLPSVNDNAQPQESDPLYKNSFHKTNNHWYQGLADKLEVVARRLNKQSENLPYLKESMAPMIAQFQSFDVEREAQSQYHNPELSLLGQMEKAIERNAVLIDSGMLISASFDDSRNTLKVDVYNQAMRKIASAESHPLVISEHEAQAPESIEFSCGQGSRLVSQHVSFEEATWQVSGNSVIANHLTEALSEISEQDLSMIINTDVYDCDNEKVTDFERIDFYEDPSAHAQADLSAKGMNVMAVSQLDKEGGDLMLTRMCKQHIGQEMEAIRVVMPQTPNIGGVDYESEHDNFSSGR